MECYVGLDVRSKRSTSVVQAGGGEVVARGDVTTTPEGLAQLRTVHGVPAGTTVTLETGKEAGSIARELTRLELRPQVIDVFEVRRKVRRPQQKSDGGDAVELVCAYGAWLAATKRGADDPEWARGWARRSSRAGAVAYGQMISTPVGPPAKNGAVGITAG